MYFSFASASLHVASALRCAVRIPKKGRNVNVESVRIKEPPKLCYMTQMLILNENEERGNNSIDGVTQQDNIH